MPVLEHGRDVALVEVAQPLDPLAERRLDGDHLDVRVLLLEEAAGAHQRAAGAEAGDEVGDLRAVLPDLRARALVVGAWVGVVAVLVQEAPLRVLGGQRLGAPHGPVGPFGARREDDLGTEHLEHLAALDGDVLRQQDLDRVALEAGDRRQGDAGVARRRFDDGLPGVQVAVLLGVLDHRLGDAILDRAERVLALQLGEDPHVRVRGQRRDVDHRRVADQVEHAVVHAGDGEHDPVRLSDLTRHGRWVSSTFYRPVGAASIRGGAACQTMATGSSVTVPSTMRQLRSDGLSSRRLTMA